jgi:hypothetical protein
MATGPGANENSDDHSSFDFSGFCPPGVRSNARKNLNFKFLKTATVVRQQIGQGFQGYFCYKERLSFAEIIFQILDIVTVSDSMFG